MVGKSGRRDFDHMSPPLWQDLKYEHGGAVFSVKYENRGDLFEGLSIWKEETYRRLKGTYPVISLSFAAVKEKEYKTARKKICQLLTKLYAEHSFLLDEYDTPMQEAYAEGFWNELVGFTEQEVFSALEECGFSGEKQYAAGLMARGMQKERIRNYGFAFQGKKVLIG